MSARETKLYKTPKSTLNNIRKGFLTTGDVAIMLRVAPRTIGVWMDMGKLIGYRLPPMRGGEQHIKSGGDRRFQVEDVMKFVRNNKLPVPRELLTFTERGWAASVGFPGVPVGYPEACERISLDVVRCENVYDLLARSGGAASVAPEVIAIGPAVPLNDIGEFIACYEAITPHRYGTLYFVEVSDDIDPEVLRLTKAVNGVARLGMTNWEWLVSHVTKGRIFPKTK